MIDRGQLPAFPERQQRPRLRVIEVDPASYRQLEAKTPLADRFLVQIGDCVDIRSAPVVVNNGAATCVSYFVELDGVMAFSGHHPVYHNLEVDDPRDAFATSKFLSQLDQFGEMVRENHQVRVTLLGQNSMLGHPATEVVPDQEFVTQQLTARGVPAAAITDRRRVGFPGVTHALYRRAENVLLYCFEADQRPQSWRQQLRFWWRQVQLRRQGRQWRS